MYPNAAHSLGDSTLYDGIKSPTRGNEETKNEKSIYAIPVSTPLQTNLDTISPKGENIQTPYSS